jgi:hypothetical protein
MSLIILVSPELASFASRSRLGINTLLASGLYKVNLIELDVFIPLLLWYIRIFVTMLLQYDL